MAAQATPNFPQFTGLVTDAANIIPADQKAALEAKLEALQKQTGRQLVVATIPDLQGDDIADYGYQLGRTWGVGLKGLDNGAILIVAPKEHKVRVEVGYGLEPVLTDAFSSVVIQQAIVPRFKAGDMVGGISAGADALAQQLSLPDEEAKAKLQAAVKQYDQSHHARQGGSHIPFGLIIWLIILFVVMASHLFRRGMGSRPLYRSGGSNWPIWLWAASEMMDNSRRGGGGGSWGGGGSSGGSDSGGGWMGGGFSGGGGGSFGGGGASGSW